MLANSSFEGVLVVPRVVPRKRSKRTKEATISNM